MYKFIKDFRGDVVFIKRLADNASIPMVEDNTDYQAYLAWLAEGNTPLAADALVPQENGDTFTLSV